MKYECKLIVKDRLSWSDEFKIYIKYKPVESKLYNPFGNKIQIINYSNNVVWDTIFAREEHKGLTTYIEEFNDMTNKEIVDLITDHIKLESSVKIKDTDKQIRRNNAISVAKKKTNTFIVEVI